MSAGDDGNAKAAKAAKSNLLDATVDDLVVPLHSRRRRKGALFQKIQHLVPCAGLIPAGLQTLSTGEAIGFERWLAIAEIATSVVLIGSFVSSLRTAVKPKGEHAAHAHGVAWFDVFAAGVLCAEAGERWHLHHRIPAATLTTAAATLAIGLLHGRLAARNLRRRSLRLTSDGITVSRRPFSRFKAAWSEIAAITVTEREAIIRTLNGRSQRLDFTDLENAPEIRAALEEGQRRLTAAALTP